MNPQLDDLRVQARYWRDKHDLYRARAYGPRPTSPARLRALERMAQAAEARLRHDEAEARAQDVGDWRGGFRPWALRATAGHEHAAAALPSD